MNYDQILQEIYQEIQPYAGQGEPAAYIPDLLKVNPDRYGICLHTLDGQDFAMGDCDERFAIQSISKVFALAMGFARLNTVFGNASAWSLRVMPSILSFSWNWNMVFPAIRSSTQGRLS